MKRNLAIVLVVLGLVGLVAVPLAGCGSGASQSQAQQNQTATVQRGNLAVNITAAGNLSLSNKEDVAIEISGTQQDPVTVREVLVEEGDSVKAGQTLVKLNVTTLEDKVRTQERAVKTAEQAVKSAESSLNKTVQDSQIQLKNAELDLETATISFNRLNYPFNYATFTFDIPTALEEMTTATHQLEKALAGLAAGPESPDYPDALAQVQKALYSVTTAQERLLRGQSIGAYQSTQVSQTVGDYLAARAAKIAMDKAQNSLEQAKSSIQINLDKANLALENAREDLDDAKDKLAEYQNDLKKSEVLAPFDGFITSIKVNGGDEAQKGTIAVQLADPNRFEAVIMVSEMDARQVKTGGEAAVTVDSLGGLSLPAKVTYIAPTATVSSGVVNLKVKVEVQSLEGVPADYQLREGITVTVNIVAQKKTSVLLVPYTAIATQGGQSYVQVVTSGGTTEKRAIKTGTTDYQMTEVTEGLVEGEKVSITRSTASSSTSTTSKTQQPGGIMLPGVGGPPPGGAR